ncbi:MAG: flagellar M-ring protein FliF [Alphaproteobacteria bacterium]|nr:flagellar M-ring protein FliF [Alphaproteobacteria bacterium]
MAFLDTLSPQTLWQRARPLLGAQPRAVLVGGAAAVLAAMLVAALWLWGSSYAVLYAGLSGEEGGRAIAELQKLNIPYRITEGGRVIQVPGADVGRARLQLAARGVAKRDGDEWALLDNQSIGVSPFVEQVHYVRGIEAALSRTVGEVDGVVSAKVTLAIPKDTGFLGDGAKPSGSVLVRLRPGFALSAGQVNGIVGLVASSVPGLSREQITVIDQSGAVLNAIGKDAALQAPQQLEIAREVNRRYETMVTELLAPLLGRGNFRISSDVDIDFSQTKESLVKYGESHVLSQDETVHTHGAGGEQAIGIPGALSNRRPDTPTTNANPPSPPAAARGAGQAGGAAPGAGAEPAAASTPPPPPSDTHKTTNYDIDKTVQYLEHPSWKLLGVNIAVLVNNPSGSPIPTERLQSINKLVSSAIGAGQNPHVTVVDLPFEMADNSAAPTGGPWWREPWMAGVARNGVLALAGLFALFGGIFPLLNRLSGAQAAIAAARPALTAPSAAAAGAAASRTDNEPQDVFSIEADTVQTLVTHDPARTAQVIRGWIAGDRSSLR